MKTFTYDEVIEIMSNCLNNLDEQIHTDKYVKIAEYSLAMDYENHVSIADATYDLDNLYDEIGIDFRKRLDDLANFKKYFQEMHKKSFS
jgi:hypothetical protein